MSGFPRIGITLDYEGPGGYSKLPWYALRENYCTAVSAHGALPFPLPHEPELAERYLNAIDGLILTGGAFDVPPALYGATSVHAAVTTKDRRTQFEWSMTKGALKRDIPILGICGGMQLLNVVMGGTLIQHIPDEVENALEHEQKNPRTEPGHTVKILEYTRLRDLLKTEEIPVNSAHHQAIARVAPELTANAIAADGVIEGVEYQVATFCLGVQWHPEYNISPADKKIFEAFVDACRK